MPDTITQLLVIDPRPTVYSTTMHPHHTAGKRTYAHLHAGTKDQEASTTHVQESVGYAPRLRNQHDSPPPPFFNGSDTWVINT